MWALRSAFSRKQGRIVYVAIGCCIYTVKKNYDGIRSCQRSAGFKRVGVGNSPISAAFGSAPPLSTSKLYRLFNSAGRAVSRSVQTRVSGVDVVYNSWLFNYSILTVRVT
jgi:hypothetical protein